MEEQDDLKMLIIEGAAYWTKFSKKFENRVTWEQPNENLIISFIPGTIIDIFVKKGQKVNEGETLLILEAMKMNNVVSMPFDGKIQQVNIKKGDIVPKNHVMIEVVPI
jgi:biotin carboxyl carrier protein